MELLSSDELYHTEAYICNKKTISSFAVCTKPRIKRLKEWNNNLPKTYKTLIINYPFPLTLNKILALLWILKKKRHTYLLKILEAVLWTIQTPYLQELRKHHSPLVFFVYVSKPGYLHWKTKNAVIFSRKKHVQSYQKKLNLSVA